MTGSAGSYRYDLPDDEAALDERALVLDAVDGETHMRWVFPRANATEAVEAAFSRANPASLPVTFKALAPSAGASPGYFLTDSDAFTVGS